MLQGKMQAMINNGFIGLVREHLVRFQAVKTRSETCPNVFIPVTSGIGVSPMP